MTDVLPDLARVRAAAAAARGEAFAAGPGVVPEGEPMTGVMVALTPPPDVIAAVARPDGSPPEALHLTLVTFPWDLTDAPDGAVDAVHAATGAVASDGDETLTVSLTHGSWFGPEGLTYALEGNVPDVTEIRDAIAAALTDAGVPWSNDYAFRLHLTIGDYPPDDPARGELVEGLLPTPVEFAVDAVTVYAGDQVTPFPLTSAAEVEEPDEEMPVEDVAPVEEPVAAADGETVTLAAPPTPVEDEDPPLPPVDEDEVASFAEPPVAPGQDLVEPLAPAPEAAEMAPTNSAPWVSPILAPYGVLSGDKRRIRGPLRNRPLPLPLAATWTIAPGHDGAILAGSITSVANTPAGLSGAGDHDLDSDVGREAARLASTRRMAGVSVDLSDCTVELSWPDGVDPADDPFGEQAILDVVDGELIGGTQVMHPAFTQAALAVVAGGAPAGVFGSHRLGYTGALTASGGAPGAPAVLSILDHTGAIVATGTPVPGRRLTFHVERLSFAAGDRPMFPKHDPLADLSGALAPLRLVDVTPSTLTAAGSISVPGSIGWQTPGPIDGGLTLVAGAGPTEPDRLDDTFLAAPPASWFAPLGDDVKGPVRSTRAGEVWGLVARWKDCHVGYADRCVPPPRSATGYRAFMTASVLCRDGEEVAAGPMFADTVHPALSRLASDAFAHYHDTGCLVMQVAAGENAHGIWVHGALMPELSPRQLRVVRAGRWSGDWRPMRESNGRPELLSILAVNGPGFPTPAEDEALVASGALVAAGRPGASALFDPDGGLLAGIGLGLVAAGDPCETADDTRDALTADLVGLSGFTVEAFAGLFGDMAARIEQLTLALADHEELLAGARAEANARRLVQLQTRMSAAAARR